MSHCTKSDWDIGEFAISHCTKSDLDIKFVRCTSNDLYNDILIYWN